MFHVNRQRIHTKNQALFSSKDKSKKLKCRLLNFFMFGILRVKYMTVFVPTGIVGHWQNRLCSITAKELYETLIKGLLWG